MAGKGGLNLTHSEEFSGFVTRYGSRAGDLAPWLEKWVRTNFGPGSRSLGFDTFVGTSGRVFPADMKAAPLLRAWLVRMKSLGVQFHMRHRWTGWSEDGQPVFQTGEPGSRSAARPWCWRPAEAAGRVWARMAPGLRCCRTRVWTLLPCRRPIAALMWAGRRGVKQGGARCLRSVMRASHSSRWF